MPPTPPPEPPTAQTDATPVPFLRLVASDDKPAALDAAIASLRGDAAPSPTIHLADPRSFRQVPGSPFAYWVSEAIRAKFRELPPFESDGRTVRVGLQTSDDYRFVRTWWEVPSARILDASRAPSRELERFQAWCREQTFHGKRWVPFAKGGAYSPYYADIHLLANWERDGEDMKLWAGGLYNNSHWSRIIKNVENYFLPGLTWPLRTSGLSFRCLPLACLFGHKGPVAFGGASPSDYLLALNALANSRPFLLFVQAVVARVSLAQSFEVGLIRSIPIPHLTAPEVAKLRGLSLKAVAIRRSFGIRDEVNHAFLMVAILRAAGDSLRQRVAREESALVKAEEQLASLQAEIDEVAYRRYDIGPEDRRAFEALLAGGKDEAQGDGGDEDDEGDGAASSAADPAGLVHDLVSYALGCAFGRWDVRLATGARPLPDLPDPFDPLPACSPGMLTGEDGLPLPEPPPGYPLAIAADGYLVDDEGHPHDVVRRLRDVFALLFGDRAAAIEREACDLLGVKELRDYVRAPRLFFDAHIRRYSKSRRKAPIYWLLQSDRRSYGVWLYAHRLTRDTLHRVLHDAVEPKLELERRALEELRAKLEAAAARGDGREERQVARERAGREALLDELERFRAELQRVASAGYDPDLDDGVLLSIAPLRRVVPWKEAEAAWKELLAGKYGWSTMARRLREQGVVAT